MKNIADVKNCCGCEMCYNICPMHAIDILSDDIGFLKPVINDKCVDCGKCLNACPMANRKPEQNLEEKYYGLSNRDENVILESASGGVFTFLCEEFLRRFPDGYVCGVVYNNDFSGVSHVVSNDWEKICKMRSSKYLQSNKKNIYTEVRALLDKECAVLFSGSACEVDALKRFLGKEYNKLWTVDYICKGTTTPKVFRDYVKNLEAKYKSQVEYVNMRYKWKFLDRWIPQYVYIGLANGKHILKQFYNTEIGLAFLILQRESCKDCPYREKKHYSDFTLGDYHAPIKGKDFSNPLGTSAVIINSCKAHDIWKTFNLAKLKIQEINYDEIYHYNRNPQDERQNVLRMNLKKYDGVTAVRKSIGLKEKIKMIIPTNIMRRITMKGMRTHE